MRRPRTIVIVVLACVGVIIAAVIAGLVSNWVSQPKQVAINDDKLLQSLQNKYPTPEGVEKTAIDKYALYANQWVIADIKFTPKPHIESDAHDEEDHNHIVTGTRCVFEIMPDTLKILVCSSEGFYESDFPDTAPSGLVERADQAI